MDKLLKLLREKGLIPQGKETELQDILKDFKPEDPEPLKVKTEAFPPEMRQTIEGLVSTVNALKQTNSDLMNALAAEKKAREDAIAAQQAELSRQKSAKIETLLTEAIGTKDKPGKITEARKEWLKKYAETDYDAASAWLKEYPGDPALGGKDTAGKDGKEAPKMVSSLQAVRPSILQAIQKTYNQGDTK